jgi:MFS family permease
MSVIITLFLSQEFKLTDTEAGVVYGIMGSLTSIYGLIVGFSIDKMGVKRSLLFGITITIVSRTALTITKSPFILYCSVFVGMPLGGCLIIPVMTLAIRRYTTTTNRGFAFGLFYSVMNIGALLSGIVVDGLAMSMPDGPVLGLSVHRWVFATGAICSVAMLLLALSLAQEVEPPDLPTSESCLDPGVWIKSVREIASLRSFWRFLGLTLITVNLRSIFRRAIPLLLARPPALPPARFLLFSVPATPPFSPPPHPPHHRPSSSSSSVTPLRIYQGGRRL